MKRLSGSSRNNQPSPAPATVMAAASLLLLMLPGHSPAALQVTLEKIVETAATTTAGRQLSAPYFSNGAVYYTRHVRSEANALRGIYRGTTQIASIESPISDAEIFTIGISDVSGTAVLISASSNHGLEANLFKSTLNISTGGAPSRILHSSSALPGYPVPHPGNPITARSTTDGQQVAFFINPYAFSTPALKGAIGLTDLSGSAISVIVKEGDPVPNGGGVFNTFDGSVRPFINGGRVVFAGNGSVRKGIFEWTTAGITTIVDSSMDRPEGGKFTATISAGNVVSAGSGTDYAFTTGSTSTVLYKKSGGQFSLVANSSTPIPGGTGTFQSLLSPSIRNGRVLFVGLRENTAAPPREYGIYTDLTGTVEPIVDVRTNLGFSGKEVDLFDIANGEAWASDDTLYFTVVYTDRTEAIFRARFTPAATALPATTVFTGPRSGTITVPTRTGYNYLLRRSENLATWSNALSTTPGTGALLAIPFNEPNAALLRMFFRVEELPN